MPSTIFLAPTWRYFKAKIKFKSNDLQFAFLDVKQSLRRKKGLINAIKTTDFSSPRRRNIEEEAAKHSKYLQYCDS